MQPSICSTRSDRSPSGSRTISCRKWTAHGVEQTGVVIECSWKTHVALHVSNSWKRSRSTHIEGFIFFFERKLKANSTANYMYLDVYDRAGVPTLFSTATALWLVCGLHVILPGFTVTAPPGGPRRNQSTTIFPPLSLRPSKGRPGES